MKNFYPTTLFIVLGIAIFLRFYQLSNLMAFIGDQGWFYLSARDALLTGKIPFVGVASSHPWLHQGAIWTYIVALLFTIFHFNPLAPGYFTAGVGVLMVWLVYKIGSNIFSPRIGMIASFFYATSPLIVIADRMPYHTSLIPLFSLLFFYCLLLWIGVLDSRSSSLSVLSKSSESNDLRGNDKSVYYFPLTILCLTILYNFELATASLWFILFVVSGYGLYKKRKWISELRDVKVLIASFFACTLPMLPMFIYDTTHGFPQTFGFVLWILYRVARVFGYPAMHPEIPGSTLGGFLQFSLEEVKRLIFVQNGVFALVLLGFGLGTFIFILLELDSRLRGNDMVRSGNDKTKNRVAKIVDRVVDKFESTNILLLTLWFFVPLFAYLVGKTTSEAYLPVLFPSCMFVLAFGFDHFLRKKFLAIPIFIVIGIIGVGNAYALVSQNYFIGSGATFAQRVVVARQIVKIAGGKRYNIVGVGPGSQFASTTMNTQYLTWWLGNGPSEGKEKLEFVIREDGKGIEVSRRM